ncbi:MAG TPA: peptidoglycan DD-metalloendopeptidase family protein [Chitinophagaceae bacterium]|nr:peptidoglycan DD-metalloendopeptidase family protein [Chitinophagaceae bacterium]
MIKKLVIGFFAFAFSLTVKAQETKEDIQKKQQELLQEIADLNSTLTQIKKNKKQSLGQLALVQRKIEKRQELITNINKDLRRINDNIYSNQVQIYHLEKELDTLKNQYAKSLVFAYKNRSNYDYLNFLFSATTFNDAIKRVAYLKSYRQYRETQVNNIVKTQQLVEQQTIALNSNKIEKNSSLKEQSKQLTVLEDDRKEKDQVVKQLKGQEKDIAIQIKEKEKTRQKLRLALQAVIRREIEAAKRKEQERLAKLKVEEAKKKKLAQQQNNPDADDNANATAKTQLNNNGAATGAVTPLKTNRIYSPFESTTEEANVSINFENNRGRLSWPADQGYVSTHFGVYQVPGTPLKGNMPGIEISLPTGSNIKAVADGVVSTIFDLGGSQTVVVRHGKYFTTYSNLSSTYVEKGQEIKAGKVVGKAAVGLSGEGQIIFMVTNDKNVNLDPERWLKSK